jgi:hypothetical protein
MAWEGVEPAVRLSTTYGIQVDPSTYKLLGNFMFSDENDMGGTYDIRWVSHRGTMVLSYTIWWEEDNDYRHKAVRRWLRENIKAAKMRKNAA